MLVIWGQQDSPKYIEGEAGDAADRLSCLMVLMLFLVWFLVPMFDIHSQCVWVPPSLSRDGAWLAMKDQLTTVSALHFSSGPGLPHPDADDFGRVHMILAGDYKQLPPATSRPPFIAADSQVLEQFDFRVLRENRRLTPTGDASQQKSLEQFHNTLEEIAFNRETPSVRQFFVDSFVRGALCTAQTVGFEDSTACFTKRRYRDLWNKGVLQRVAKSCGRSLRVKAVFATRGAERHWIREEAAAEIRRTVRSQSCVSLRLAGQWVDDAPAPPATKPHWMRAMLVANVDVANGFANGAAGRIVHWGPDMPSGGLRKQTVLANVPEVQVRFLHEASASSSKAHFLPLVDFLDVEPRKETVPTAKGKPWMLQLQVQPAYGLTIHKVQALTIRHVVNGCLEGVFAQGQIYVLNSRVTQQEHYRSIGIPPIDLLEDVAKAWQEAGIDVNTADISKHVYIYMYIYICVHVCE